MYGGCLPCPLYPLLFSMIPCIQNFPSVSEDNYLLNICLILIFSYLSFSSGLQDQHLHSKDSPSISAVRSSLINFFDGQYGEIASHTCFLTQPKGKQKGTIIGQGNNSVGFQSSLSI